MDDKDASGLSRKNLFVGAAGLLAARTLPKFVQPKPVLSKSTLITEPYIVVETVNGKLRGGQCRGALAFKGVPYAAPLTSANRFKPAQPLEPWTGVRDALALGNPAPQSPNTVYGEREPHPAEDCLVLNVWTPAVGGKKRPVLFYNHGGGFASGSAGSVAQDGGRLAALHDVVVVATNHRLGMMGYLSLHEIGGNDYTGSGNAGMLDLVEALRWVKANIEAFGGDPHNVTIFGESGGGAKTSVLMAMPSAQGLFHKAGIMSGPLLRVKEKAATTEMARAVLKALEISPDQLHKLNNLPLQQLLDVQFGKHGSLPGDFGPMLDGDFISQHPFDPAPAPFVAGVPLLIGNNRDEATFYYWQNPDVFKMDETAMEVRLKNQMGEKDAAFALSVFRKERPNATPVELYIAISTGGMWGETLEIAQRKTAQNGAPVYMYRYDYESNYPIKGTDWTLRAGHATEIQSKFENPDLGGLMGTKPDRFIASKNFGEVWTSFAKSGHPHAPGVHRWPAYNLEKRSTMLVDIHCSVAEDPHKMEREAMIELLKKG